MEIRRKVFSLLQNENGEERYYSTNEFEISYDEETGEKMFSEKEGKKKGMSTGAKVAAGTAGAAVVGVGGLEAAYHGAKALAKKNSNGRISYEKGVAKEELKKMLENREINKSQFESAVKKLDKTSGIRRKLGKIAKDTEEKLSFVGKAEDAVAGASRKAAGAVKDAAAKVGESAGKGLVWAKDKAGNLYKASIKEAKALGIKVKEAGSRAATKGKALAEKAIAGSKKFAGSKTGKIVGLSAAGVGLAGAGLGTGLAIGKRKRAE